MYQLVEIIAYRMTRDVALKDLATDRIEMCFDDSDITSNEGFGFMQIGHQYDCKILLFGDPVAQKTDESVTCKVVHRNVVVGKWRLVEVQVNGGTYYVSQKRVQSFLDQGEFEYEFTRKDLIQVNDVIHGELL